MKRFLVLGMGLTIAVGLAGRRPAPAFGQDAPPLEQPSLEPLADEPAPEEPSLAPQAAEPAPEQSTLVPQEPPPDEPGVPVLDPRETGEFPEQLAAAPPDADRPVRPLSEGPLHEAFLSPARDRDPEHVPKSPPPPISERPGVDAPSPDAQWIEGYWEWDAGRNDFVWVTGTWRVSPPGRMWVNGYWKRDDQGWFRVPGFWSERSTDRIDWRKDGPPADRPAEEPGEAPGPDHFYIPGQYVPDGDGVVWKPGCWAESRPGWAWVPAQWVKQPEGWTFQEGYWDRVLEDRGTLFAPAEVDEPARVTETVYKPYTEVSPESYGLLYGAFGRPTTYYDGYPGCYFDSDGRYYGYADYGTLGSYYGYLDYPYISPLVSPYITSPVPYDGGGLGYGGFGGLGYGNYGGYGGGYGGYGGAGLAAGLLSSAFGFGSGGLGYGGLGYGGYGGLGYGGDYGGLWWRRASAATGGMVARASPRAC